MNESKFFAKVAPMIHTYYIDAYNVMFKMSGLVRLMKADREVARQSFVGAITQWLPRNEKVFIVFDGGGEEQILSSRIKVIFTRSHTADSFIRQQLEKLDRRKNVIVVSSDHEVMNHTVALGAKIIRAEDFIAALKPRHEVREEPDKDRPVTRSEIDMWLKEFKK